MKLSIFAIATLLTYPGLFAPAQAQNPAQIKQNNSLVQVQQTPEQIINACVQNQAETLPNPFTDVPSNHWAYKAVLTMYYCGAYREGMNPALIKESLESGDTTRESLPSRSPFPNFPLQPFPVIN
ncbi:MULTISPECIES: S-layer protein [unclassified Microcoleus]|uniref:S-layer protein n=1 Tax=unclassified Microcoleus TaxID=2642155 RepID=UPI002FD750E1